MATSHFITSDILTGSGDALAMSSGDYLYLAPDVLLGATDGISAAVKASNGGITAQIHGAVFGFNALDVGLGNNRIAIGSDASVTGVSAGIQILGLGHNTITNHGQIDAPYAIVMNGAGNVVNNSGTISSYGVTETFSDTIRINSGGQANGATIINSGTIINDGEIGRAIVITSTALDGANLIDNSGTISASGGSAIETGDATTKVVNTGHIAGDIHFSNGKDIYNGTLGDIDGSVYGGNSADTLKGGVGDDVLFGDDGGDLLKGGDGDDVLAGGHNADHIFGGAGNDIFVYVSMADSKGFGHDTIVGFDPNEDSFDLNVSVSAIDSAVTTGVLDAATLVADVIASVGPGQLAAHHAVLFTANSGDLAGHTFLVVDTNGSAGYQVASDYLFELLNSPDLGALSTADFV